ncbi:hypothetical protein L249_5164 [Ophiocordyceps polyrhachis-furcata BCC 54312]|uniref:Uncharacterized protein n=1 Tax=Ophiocordyceps polyrhachis-furcata BCC 54312 TaxID=1330021 RepID=A0A367L927_9HYPO|nr:hypothetical protein L249_5164 [Ophiocordyceps polyrhachis-furcata BCC 54312]
MISAKNEPGTLRPEESVRLINRDKDENACNPLARKELLIYGMTRKELKDRENILNSDSMTSFPRRSHVRLKVVQDGHPRASLYHERNSLGHTLKGCNLNLRQMRCWTCTWQIQLTLCSSILSETPLRDFFNLILQDINPEALLSL